MVTTGGTVLTKTNEHSVARGTIDRIVSLWCTITVIKHNKGSNVMHCIEIKAVNFKSFKELIKSNGGEVSIVSKYQDSGIRWLDVEVSKDTVAIDTIEKRFGYAGE